MNLKLAKDVNVAPLYCKSDKMLGAFEGVDSKWVLPIIACFIARYIIVPTNKSGGKITTNDVLLSLRRNIETFVKLESE